MLVPLSLTTVALPGFSGLGVKTILVPGGSAPADSVIVLEKKQPAIVPSVTSMNEGTGQPELTAGGTVNSNPCCMEKSELEISKKILPIASTFILAVLVVIQGKTNASAPSLGVLAANTVG